MLTSDPSKIIKPMKQSNSILIELLPELLTILFPCENLSFLPALSWDPAHRSFISISIFFYQNDLYLFSSSFSKEYPLNDLRTSQNQKIAPIINYKLNSPANNSYTALDPNLNKSDFYQHQGNGKN